MASKNSRITGILSIDKRGYSTSLKEAGTEARMFGKILAGVATGAGVKSLFSAAAGRESLLRGLAAVSDGTRDTAQQFKRLQEVAVRNAASIDTVTGAFTQLRGAALSSEDAEKVIDGVANALNRIGRGADLDAVMTNFRQVAGQAAVAGDEVKEIAAYLPEIQRLSKLRFGAADGEGLSRRGVSGRQWIMGIAEELAKYERASGGAAAATARLEAAWRELRVTAGNELLKPGTNMIGAVASGLETAARDFSLIMQNIRGELEPDAPLAPREDIAEKRRKNAAEAAALEARRAEEVEAALQKEIDLGLANYNLKKAEAAADDEGLRAAMEELAALKDKQAVMRQLNATEAEALEIIRQRVRWETAAANAARDAERRKSRAANAGDLDRLEAEAWGLSPRRLKRMDRKRRLGDETARLEGMGIARPHAEKLAERRIKAEDTLEENRDRAARGLRPRIRSFRGEEGERRAWYRLSDARKAEFARLGDRETGETGFAVFRRKRRGGLAAYDDPPMRERNNPFPEDGTTDQGAALVRPRPGPAPEEGRRVIKGAGHRAKPGNEAAEAGSGSAPGGNSILGVLQRIEKNTANLSPSQPSDRLKPRR